MADRHLITSALPYVSGVKHLGNLAGSLLPADVHARFLRQAGNEVLFICATDEHGTPAELAAREAGLPVAEFCQRLHDLQADIYCRFGLSFDHFGRTSSALNRDLTQHLYRRQDASGLIEERIIRQYFSPTDDRFLPDRYVVGTCPHCSNPRARGDQCEACTRVLDPTDLIRPRSTLSGADDLVLRDTRHLFLRQSALAPEIERWVKSQEEWPPIVIAIARAWLAAGLHDRCITRDLAWGIPVPRPGFEGKVFYVWFDAPVGYISATQEWANADPTRRDWRRWWWGEDAHREVRYVQFLGKDNVPFHAVSFPATLIGSGEPWKLVDVIKGFNWLTYEGGKFSTSEGRGIFTDAALEELPADLWRWWLVSNAPESSDTDFDFHRFAADVNADLADSFGNLANRLLSFAATRFGEEVPLGGELGPVGAAGGIISVQNRGGVDAAATPSGRSQGERFRGRAVVLALTVPAVDGGGGDVELDRTAGHLAGSHQGVERHGVDARRRHAARRRLDHVDAFDQLEAPGGVVVRLARHVVYGYRVGVQRRVGQESARRVGGLPVELGLRERGGARRVVDQRLDNVAHRHQRARRRRELDLQRRLRVGQRAGRQQVSKVGVQPDVGWIAHRVEARGGADADRRHGDRVEDVGHGVELQVGPHVEARRAVDQNPIIPGACRPGVLVVDDDRQRATERDIVDLVEVAGQAGGVGEARGRHAVERHEADTEEEVARRDRKERAVVDLAVAADQQLARGAHGHRGRPERGRVDGDHRRSAGRLDH
jgi:methionyl-tRNA synthetase